MGRLILVPRILAPLLALAVAACTQQTIVINQAPAKPAAPNPAPAPARTSPLPQTASQTKALRLEVPNQLDKPVTYLWNGESYQGAEIFMRVVEAQISAALARISDNQTRLGSLRLILPERHSPPALNPLNPAGQSEAQDVWKRFHAATDQGRLAALQKSGLFSPIEVETGSVGIAEAGRQDYVLWHDGAAWRLRYRKAEPYFISDSNDLPSWSGAVRNFASSAKTRGDGSSAALVTHFPSTPGGKTYFTFKGMDHFTLASLQAAMEVHYDQEAAKIQHVATRLGGRAKIVLASQTLGTANLPQTTGNSATDAQQAFMRAASLGRAKALRGSGLFASVSIAHADVSDVAMEDWDVVIWQPATRPFSWRFRVKGTDDAWNFDQPPTGASTQELVDSMARQMLAKSGKTSG